MNLFDNLKQEDLVDLLKAYDVYIATAVDARLSDMGWVPVCVEEFYANDYQNVWKQGEGFDYLSELGMKKPNRFSPISEPGNIKIDLGFATLVAEKGSDPNYNEVFVGLEDKDGVWSQDLAIVRQKYHYENCLKATEIDWDVDYEGDRDNLPTEIVVPAGMEDEDDISDYLSDVTGFCHKGFVLVNDSIVLENAAQVLVFADKDDEDYTHEFSIDVYEDEREHLPLDSQIRSVAYYAENKEIKTCVLNSDKLRNMVLEICYKIPGYEQLPTKEKNILYDIVKKSASYALSKEEGIENAGNNNLERC